MDVPLEVQLPLLLKILAFDRELPERAGDEIVIGVLYQDRVTRSFLVKDEFISLVRASHPGRIHDLPVRVVAVRYRLDMDLAGELASRGIDVLYVTPMRRLDLPEIATAARSRRVLTLTGVPGYVRAGIAVGVERTNDGARIVINLPAARAEGSNFHAHLLRLANVIDD